MTPFDPIALLAMLQAFYPVVGPAALARARRERPDYFAGGELVGSSGDKLRLLDGRIFDLIFDVLGPNTRWQAIEVGAGPGAPDVDDPFALEAGPLVPIDLSAWPDTPAPPVFTPLVAGAIQELGASGTILDDASSTIAAHSSPAAFEDAFGRTIEPAATQLAAEGYALDQADPSDVLVQTAAQSSAIDAEAGVYDEPPPAVIDPGPPLPKPPIEVPTLPDTP